MCDALTSQVESAKTQQRDMQARLQAAERQARRASCGVDAAAAWAAVRVSAGGSGTHRGAPSEPLSHTTASEGRPQTTASVSCRGTSPLGAPGRETLQSAGRSEAGSGHGSEEQKVRLNHPSADHAAWACGYCSQPWLQRAWGDAWCLRLDPPGKELSQSMTVNWTARLAAWLYNGYHSCLFVYGHHLFHHLQSSSMELTAPTSACMHACIIT